jgi:predicted dehydrogenase
MTIRLGVVGIGRRGREWVRTVRETSGFELSACVDVDAAALRHAATALDVPADRCHERLEDALDAARPHALIVATPLDRHVDPCRTALMRGLAVLVEKPFATSLREARQLQTLADQTGAPLLVGQNYRYTRMPRAVRRLVDEGVLGRVGMVACQAYRGQQDQVSPSVKTLREGVLWELAVHHLDALRYVLRQEVVHVMAQSFSLPWSAAPSGASLQVLLAFDGGTRASYSATYDSVGNEFFERGNRFHLRVLGEHGTLSVWQRWVVLCQRGRAPRLVRRGRREVSEEVALLRQLERALRSGAVPECNGRDNLRTVAVLEACARSTVEGRWVDPRELFGEPI